MILSEIVQKNLFDTIAQVERDNKKWKQDLEELLSLKRASVYKKISGEIKLSLEEFFTLCDHYQLDYNFLTRPEGTSATFTVPFLEDLKVSQEMYMRTLVDDLLMSKELQDPVLWISALEIPLVYDYNFPEITAFKHYMNEISNWQTNTDMNRKFSFQEHLPTDAMKENFSIALDAYCDIKTVEFWNPYQLDITLHQLSYCIHSGLFHEAQDSLKIIDALSRFADYISEMALEGRKFFYRGDRKTGLRASCEMYYNEISHTNSFAFLQSVQKEVAYITVDTPHYIISEDQKMCDYFKQWTQKLQRSSLLISGQAHRNRLEFINGLKLKIRQKEEQIRAMIG